MQLVYSLAIVTGLSIAGLLIARAVAQSGSKASRDRIRKHPPGMEESDPYSLRQTLLMASEASFYEALVELVPRGFVVFAKVCMAELVNVTYGAGDRGQAHGRVSTKRIDFVVMNRDRAPVLAMQIVDGTVDRDEARNRAFLARVFQKIGLPYEEVPAAPSYSHEQVRSILEKYFEPGKFSAAAA